MELHHLLKVEGTSLVILFASLFSRHLHTLLLLTHLAFIELFYSQPKNALK